MTLESRFWSKVRKTDTCWVWTGVPDSKGYGRIRSGGAGSKIERAHRVSYKLAYGEIPDDLPLDHTCRNKLCVRPQHLEPVTQRENLLRSPDTLPSIALAKTHCPQDHEYTKENTYLDNGARKCKTCRVVKNKRQYERRKSLALD